MCIIYKDHADQICKTKKADSNLAFYNPYTQLYCWVYGLYRTNSWYIYINCCELVHENSRPLKRNATNVCKGHDDTDFIQLLFLFFSVSACLASSYCVPLCQGLWVLRLLNTRVPLKLMVLLVFALSLPRSLYVNNPANNRSKTHSLALVGHQQNQQRASSKVACWNRSACSHSTSYNFDNRSFGQWQFVESRLRWRLGDRRKSKRNQTKFRVDRGLQPWLLASRALLAAGLEGVPEGEKTGRTILHNGTRDY